MNWELILNVFGSGVFVGIYFAFAGTKLFKEKIPRKILNLVIIILLMVFNAVNFLLIDNIWKTIFSYISVCIAYLLLFRKSVLQCELSAFISYFPIILGEISLIAVLTVLEILGINVVIPNLGGNAFTNLVIILFATIYILLIYKSARRFILKIKSSNKITLIITFTLLLMSVCALFYKLYFHEYKMDSYLILNLVLLLTLTYIAVVVLKQQYDKAKLGDEYERYVNYSKQSEKLVDQYSISQHENKNELIIIRSMVNKNNKELIEYLDEIICSKDNIDDAWIRCIRYLPFGGLKGIIHNKISEMKDDGINVFLNISREIENSKLKDLTIKQNNQLSKIIGVFLDNAREAAMLSKDKKVSISVYLDDSDITFEISNTYINEVDLSKIYDIGNSSKGKGRGYGLALVESILNENKIFKNETKQVDEFFVQILKTNI